MAWQAAARRMIAEEGASVLVTVADLRGSAPREAGAKMLVSARGAEGSIGGGHLEYAAIDAARRLLADPGAPAVHTLTLPLGPALGQCCGGSVDLVFERLSGGAAPSWLGDWEAAAREGADRVVVTRLAPEGAPKAILDRDALARSALPNAVRSAAGRMLSGTVGTEALLVAEPGGPAYMLERLSEPVERLHLFGAGHVGRAIVRALAPLPFRVTWIDGRAEMFPAELPDNVAVCPALQPRLEVDRAEPGDLFLVMTHSHPLDLEICERVLRRGDFRFLGLIGSATKRARFASRLRARGLSEAVIARLTCPVGVPGISGKRPAIIAASVAAQLLAVVEAARSSDFLSSAEG
jgi:xanthine dehydrogenase accessory factor